jgi:hypothetical protein
LPVFDLTNAQGRDRDVQPPKLFAPTPTPAPEILVTNTQKKRASQESLSPGGITPGERDKGSNLRISQRIRLEPVRMPIPRIHSATSTSSLPGAEHAATGCDQPQGRKPSALTLKKALSNVDVAPSNSSQGKALASKQKSQSTFRPPLKMSSALQKNNPPLVSSPIRRTASSTSVKNSSPSPSNSPRRGSEQLSSPDRKRSGDSRTLNSPTSLSDWSEFSSDRDVRSPTLSSSSDGEV